MFKTDKKEFIELVQQIYGACMSKLVPVGDLVKQTLIIRNFHFLGVDKPNYEIQQYFLNQELFPDDEFRIRPKLIERLEDYSVARGKHLLVQRVSDEDFGLYQFYFNYNKETVNAVIYRLYKLGYKKDENDMIVMLHNGKKEEFKDVEEVFSLAGMEYFPPDSPLNV